MTKASRDAALVFVGALVYFAIGASSRGLWHSDEHRYAEVSREMLSGGEFLVPHLDGEVYVHKPPLFNWITALVHGPLGVDLAVAAKVPAMLGAATAALATFLIARRLYGEVAGLFAAIVLATAGEFDWIARTAHLDALLAGATTLATWFFVRAVFPGPPEEERRPTLWTALGFLCVGLGVIVKGPPALVIPGVAVVGFAALAGEWKLFATRRLAWALVALAPGALWLGAAVLHLGDPAGPQYARDIVLGQAVAHAAGQVDKLEPWWFYVYRFPGGLLPWTLLLPAAFVAAFVWRKAEERRADLFAVAWLLAPWIAMSISPAKRSLYLVPVYPAAALLVARLVVVPEARLYLAVFAVPRYALAVVALLVGAGTTLLAALVTLDADAFVTERLPWWPVVRGALGWSGPILAAVIGVFVAGFGWKALCAASPLESLQRIALAALVGSIGYAAVALPCADAAQSERRFYDQAAPIVGDSPLARYGVDDFAGHWTLRRDTIPFVKSAEGAARFLADAKTPAFVVAEREFLERHGVPAGSRIVLEQKLPLAHDLVLLTKQ